MELRFYECPVCGQIVTKVKDTTMSLVCCGKPMNEITPKENEEGLNEKHIPVCKFKKNKVIVKVGETYHPSTSEHFIEWIAISTNKGIQRQTLKPGDVPEVIFYLDDGEKVERIYAYCNLHSLWLKKVERGCGCVLCGCHTSK